MLLAEVGAQRKANIKELEIQCLNGVGLAREGVNLDRTLEERLV